MILKDKVRYADRNKVRTLSAYLRTNYPLFAYFLIKTLPKAVRRTKNTPVTFAKIGPKTPFFAYFLIKTLPKSAFLHAGCHQKNRYWLLKPLKNHFLPLF